MFLERKSKNATVSHTQDFKMGSFEVKKKSGSLPQTIFDHG